MHLRIKSKRKIIRNIILLILIGTLCLVAIWSRNHEEGKKIEGQVLVHGKDGYDNLFSWQEKNYKEFKQNKGSWAKKVYWDDTMQTQGCGITAIAIIASGYGKDITPETLRKSYYPHLEGDSIPKVLKKDYEINCTDFVYQESHFTKEYILNHLKKGKPIIVCVVNKPTIKWTTSSHYLVLLGSNEEDKVYVSNPNGERNSSKASNWYSTDDILPYIVKAVFVTE